MYNNNIAAANIIYFDSKLNNISEIARRSRIGCDLFMEHSGSMCRDWMATSYVDSCCARGFPEKRLSRESQRQRTDPERFPLK
jgi:hypothetical protein